MVDDSNGSRIGEHQQFDDPTSMNTLNSQPKCMRIGPQTRVRTRTQGFSAAPRAFDHRRIQEQICFMARLFVSCSKGIYLS